MTDDMIESHYVISDASQENAGTYTCRAITLVDEAEKSVSHVKVFQGTVIVSEPRTLEVVEGSKIPLDCSVVVSPHLLPSL